MPKSRKPKMIIVLCMDDPYPGRNEGIQEMLHRVRPCLEDIPKIEVYAAIQQTADVVLEVLRQETL